MHADTGIKRIDAGTITVWSTPVDAVPRRHERREAERMAVDRLLEAAFGPHAALGHESTGAPYIYFDNGDIPSGAALSTGDISISISHCADTAMLCAATGDVAIGIDCEHFRPALRNVASRVLSPSELAEWGGDDLMLLRAWTIKEAVYKAAGCPGLPLAEGIRLPHPDATSGASASLADGRRFRLIFLHGTAPAVTIAVGETGL